MLFSFSLPSFVSAADDKGLENAIKTAKTMFKIPSDFDFNYQMSLENGKRIWSLSWNSKDGTKGGINIRLDDNGVLLGYDNYKPTDNISKKLPKYSRKDAQSKAEAFIKKVNPSVMSQIKLYDAGQTNSITDYTYYFTYVRVVGKIPFYSNNVTLSINKNTGEVVNYSYNWTDGLTFPAAGKAMSVVDAGKAYMKNIGLKLIYKYKSENDKVTTYPAYVPVVGDNFAIDALTGDKVQTGNNYVIFNDYERKVMYSKAKGDQPVELTPDEIKAVEEASKLISKEAAEKIARSCDTLKLTDEYKLTYINLNKAWPNNNDTYWSMNFSTENGELKAPRKSVNVTINAKTGEITAFNQGSSADDKDPVKFDEASAKAAVNEFLKSFNPEKYSQVEYDETNGGYPVIKSNEDQRSYSFTYLRKVNGIQFPDNSISIYFDAVSGEITYYSMTWFSVDFVKVDKVISFDKAYEKAFSQIGLELQYKIKYSDEEDGRKVIPAESTEKPEVVLVYSLNSLKPSILDANTGIVLDYDGNPFKDVNAVKYSDIKGHSAQKQIEVLAEAGISLDGTQFKPNAKITQKDFLTLLSKIMPNYYGPIILENSKTTVIDSFYSYLLNQNVIKESEKAPNSATTKEDAVKFFIRALKYNEVADIKGIFKCSFKDSSKITPSLYGYFAIAEGLKLVSADKKGNVNPKAVLTRADAMVMIYNYLSH